MFAPCDRPGVGEDAPAPVAGFASEKARGGRSCHLFEGLLSLCVFPIRLPEQTNYKFIDCAHAMLKPFYMNAGLMLGEFHPRSAVRGARSESIFPMRADVPAFVIRSIALHDLLFIDQDWIPVALHVHELECYLRGASTLLPRGEAVRIEERIDQLKYQLLATEVERSAAQMWSL